MREWLPLLIVGAVIGVFSTVFIIAYALIKDKKEAIGFDRNMKDGELAKRLLKYARPYVGNFILVGLMMVFAISYEIVSPLIIAYIQRVISTPGFQMPTLIVAVVVYASVLILSLICSYFQAIILQKTGQKIISAMREEIFTHIESLSHSQLNNIPVGKLVTRVTNDTNGISMMFTNIIVNLTKNCFVIVGVLVAMLCINYMLTLMVLCFVPFVVLFTVIFRKFSRKAHRKVKDGTTDINTFLSENLSGMKVIQIFNREDLKMDEFSAKNSKLEKARKGQMFVFSIFRPTVYMLYVASVLCLFFLGGKGYIDGWKVLGQVITADVLIAFYLYISKFFNPIQTLAEQFNWLQSAFASAEKIFSILDMKPEVVDAEDAIELNEIKGEIEFKDVWFSYIPNEWVLKGVSFKVEAKQTVAFVGSTGSGKTTILSLLCRNYDIQRGEILVDGIKSTG